MMIKYFFKTIKIPKMQVFFLLLTSSIILFLALILANGLLIIGKEKNLWHNEHDYYRQITFNHTPDFNLKDYEQRKISFKHELAEFKDSKKNVIIANYLREKYFFESDLKSGFKIIGRQPQAENEIIVSYDFYINNQLDLKNSSEIYLGDNSKYTIVGYFNSLYSSYLRSSSYYFDILKKSDFFDESYIVIIELHSFNEVLNFNLEGSAITFKKEIKNMNFYFIIINIIIILFFIIIILISSMTCLLTSLFLINENWKSLFIFVSQGLRKKYLLIFSCISVLIFVSISITISFFIKLIVTFILNYYSKKIIFGNFDILKINLLSFILVFITSFIMFFLVIILRGKRQLEETLSGEMQNV